MSQYIVGLTGGIGSGKTTVTQFFIDLGIDIVDADIVARQVVEPSSLALNQIKQHFGDDILQPDGHLNRTKLRSIVFANEDEKLWLNNLLHPLIRESMLNQLQASKSQYCILVAPLLIENKLDKLVNSVLVVDIDEQTQIERVLKRDSSDKQEVKNIIASQVSRSDRLTAAHYVINNQSTDLNEIKSQVEKLHQEFILKAIAAK